MGVYLQTESKPSGRMALTQIITCAAAPASGTGIFLPGDTTVDVTIPACIDEIRANVLTSTVVRLIQIHSNVTSVANSAFAGSPSLRSLVWDCCSISAIPDSLCEDCSALDDVRLHRYTESIGAKAFVNCRWLKQAHMPAVCKTIKMYAFAGSGITDVLLPRGVVLGPGVFSNCKQLATVVESGELNEIPEDTFQECTALATCIVGSAKTLKRHAFYKCAALKYVLAYRDVRIVDGAFEGVPAVTLVKTYE